ncbi:MAG: uL15 family ribosomal protein [Candidatus Pacebacteria bacterium]|nr:uL15 family ribosomal protein [Candidatus Paceibacterota bacterium]
MQTHELKRKNPNRKAKKVGRGGLRGKTSGRGHKGQKQHGGHGIRAEIRDQIKKLPKLRGRGVNSNKSIKNKPNVFNCAFLEENFKAGDVVSPVILMERGLLTGAMARKAGVKILGNGELTKKLSVENCKVSVSAAEKISKAGGIVA